MGNLLGAPVTEKETHTGATGDGVEFGVSSMQGWRVHMEDAHITEARLYAAEATGSGYKHLALPGHALFAVFDGHGGKFAAEYCGRNFCRVLSRQAKFIEYAKFEQARAGKEESFKDPTERAAFFQPALTLLQEALIAAFVEIDKEIACALKGQKVPDADQPYHDDDEDLPDAFDDPPDEANDHSRSMEDEDEPAEMPTSPSSPFGGHDDEGDSGTTACVVLLTSEWIICANAGDSRSVISRLGNKAVPLSYDHKPDDEPEERRIRAAGGYVAGGRVEGDLAVSRGLGDFRFKSLPVVMQVPFSGIQPQENGDAAMDGGDHGARRPAVVTKPGEQKVSPVPDIIVQTRNATQDEFLIVACDGIWDVQTNYEAVQSVAEIFKEGESNLGLVCEEFCDLGLSMGSKDNITVLVVKFAAQKVGEGGGVLARRQRREAEAEEKPEESPSGPNPQRIIVRQF